MAATLRREPAAAPFAICLSIVLAVTLIRIIGLRYSVVDLFVDEAQYWSWSREFSFGYFSKPPLLAWIIAASTSICGDGEACVRAASPVLYLGTSLLAYAIAAELYDLRTARWSALAIALAPGVAFSSRIISTDVPLLFFWALALLAFVKMLRGGGLAWAATLGCALGLGLLAKYAMIYFVLGIALVAAIDRDTRTLLRRSNFWLALAIAAIVVAPNLVWNQTHGWHTFKHTGGLVHADQIGLKPLEGLEFLGAQFSVIGPIVFGGLLWLMVRFRTPLLLREDRWMVAFAVPPLALMAGLAFVHGAYINWAATALISAAIVVTAVLVRQRRWRWLGANLVIGIAVQLSLLFGDAAADRITASVADAKYDPYSRTMGWREFAAQTRRLARRVDAKTIAADNRYDIAALVYYLRDFNARLLAFRVGADAKNEFEISHAPVGPVAEPILFISPCPSTARPGRYFRSVTPLGLFSSKSGPNSRHFYYAFVLSGRRDGIGPLGECQ